MRTMIAMTSAALMAIFASSRPLSAANFEVDPVHSGITFKISHMGIGWVYGRFDSFTGSFSVDPNNAAASSFAVNIKADSIDSGNKKRDEHLASPDFFNVKQFPTIEFKSTAVTAGKDGLGVTGDLTMHGVTKSISLALKGGRMAEFPQGTHRTAYVGQVTIKRSDFGIDKFKEMLGDEILVDFSFEGVQK